MMSESSDPNLLLQIEGMVSNGLAEASVLWNFTVVNVNEHPRFSLALFEKTILEDAEPGPILKLELSDPDDSTEDKNFQIKNVSAICEYFSAKTVPSKILFHNNVVLTCVFY